jgi:hypothetical protein
MRNIMTVVSAKSSNVPYRLQSKKPLGTCSSRAIARGSDGGLPLTLENALYFPNSVSSLEFM